MANERSFIERAPLPPPGAPTVEHGDRSRIFGIIGKQLDAILNGPESYYPDGTKKEPDALLDDLTGFYSSVEQLGRQLNDPTNIMGDVLDELRKFNGAFAPMAKWSDPSMQRDKAIELPPELAPKTLDQNNIEIDPFGGPFAPRMPWREPKKDLNVSAEVGRPEASNNGAGQSASRAPSTTLATFRLQRDGVPLRYLRSRPTV
ncbi:hypothetical protein [Bradyrhizobium sp. HKCCYLR20261]|uniref:hypothetical protein n=1 Tax=unclassified Bradyrhizobium TaxID=2631580 RepID=UPI003EBA679D